MTPGVTHTLCTQYKRNANIANERLRIPAFHQLLHAEGYLANTSVNDQQGFNAMVCALPMEVATLMHETIASPPGSNSFAALKRALLEVYQRPDHDHPHELLNTTLGDMRALPSLAADATYQLMPLPEAILKLILLQKLPLEVRVALLSLDENTTATVYAYLMVPPLTLCPHLSGQSIDNQCCTNISHRFKCLEEC